MFLLFLIVIVYYFILYLNTTCIFCFLFQCKIFFGGFTTYRNRISDKYMYSSYQ